MLIKTEKNYYILEELAKYPKIFHSFSSRIDGDLGYISRDGRDNREKFAQKINLDWYNIVEMNQIHQSNIKIVTEKDKGKRISRTDGLITVDKGVYLIALVADCIPLLFFDAEKEVVGVAHAGWMGTVARISQKMIYIFRENFASKAEKIQIGFGPSIGPCCYDIPTERAELIKKKIGEKYFLHKKDKIYFNLWEANKNQLIESGIRENHIYNPQICNSCHSKDFFSFRQEGLKTGRFLGLIGMKSL